MRLFGGFVKRNYLRSIAMDSPICCYGPIIIIIIIIIIIVIIIIISSPAGLFIFTVCIFSETPTAANSCKSGSKEGPSPVETAVTDGKISKFSV